MSGSALAAAAPYKNPMQSFAVAAAAASARRAVCAPRFVRPFGGLARAPYHGHAGADGSSRSRLVGRCIAPFRVRSNAVSASQGSGRFTVVLDMDECLIHSCDFSDDTSGGNWRLDAEGSKASPELDGDSFRLNLPGGASCTVRKRPGLDEFLKACTAEFETFVFTAGVQAYADPLLDHLDPSREMLAGRFYRHDCRPLPLQDGQVQYLKDLTAISDDLTRLVLVDNNPMSFLCQPDNGIPVPDFTGSPDNVLPAVLNLLRQLQPLEDVRPELKKMFNLESQLSEMSARLLGAAGIDDQSKL